MNELAAQRAKHPAVLRGVEPRGVRLGYRRVDLELDTTQMQRAAGGMMARDIEPVVVWVPPDAMGPPIVMVQHDRFVGVPHALHDGQLCIYLDPAQEWDPAAGAAGFLQRLYDWFEKAVAGKFDAATALFHAVGGMSHVTHPYPVVICREDLDLSKTLSFAWLVTVNDYRVELRNQDAPPASSEQVLVVQLTKPLFTGPGVTLRELLHRDGLPDVRAVVTAWKQRIARRIKAGDETVHLVLAVPNVGGVHQLLVGRLTLKSALAAEDGELPLDWCPISDERPSISQRRDASRPLSGFFGRDVAVVGCGGLGSWLAEYLVRAGVASIELLDYGKVSGGLLVRQNFTDADIALPKSVALARRLEALAPSCVVTATEGSVSERLEEVLRNDRALVLDATVSRAMARHLDALSHCADRLALVAQVATDVRTGSLGMVVVSSSGAPGPLTIDTQARQTVLADGRLEPYRTFWEPRDEDELIPALGCSIPTFHGSSADMAAVAAEQANLIARHLGSGVSGTHLFALPHTGISPSLHFIPHQN